MGTILEKLSERLKGKRILILGDVGLDEYVNGGVQRISPEAPVPIVDVNQQERRLGLSANVAQNILSLGGVPILSSVVGDDEAGKHLKELLSREGIITEELIVDSERPTTKKLRVMSGHNHIVRVDFERKSFLSTSLEQLVLQKLESNLSQCDGVVIQDYAKGMISESLIKGVVKLAQEKDVPILVDPHRSTPLAFYKGVDVFKPNFDEAIALTGTSIDSLHQEKDIVTSMGKRIKDILQVKNIVLTQGAEGMTVFPEKGEVVHVPTEAKKVFDVTGAGDTVIAALSLAWCSGFTLEEACRIANSAAGVVVAQIGCGTCSLDELLAAMGE